MREVLNEKMKYSSDQLTLCVVVYQLFFANNVENTMVIANWCTRFKYMYKA
jgi:hypothetical protein